MVIPGIRISFFFPEGFSQNFNNPEVKVWEEKVIIPTYLTGDPEVNPMFFFGRQSQGAEGRIYPYPLYDTMTDEKKDKSYLMIYLENEFLKIGIAPELGGRIFSGLDKTNGYNFFYKQSVIKPQLIGLIGAWISGGVEWNIPHHHRATTFMPVQYRIEKNNDGSKTVWVGELELRHRMRWAVGYTLYPGKSFLELSLRIVNRTPEAQSMLCFANAAVHTNENYQVIFPPSTQFGTFHHKKEFVNWPLAKSIYNGADFTRGVDISWYKNHYNSNSVFAWNYTDNFLAGYDHGREAGVLSIADHHIIPGKKFWTWGNGPRGKMWDKLLTDDDGPYIELMVGSFSDNQPDYSWLQPYETRSFKEYWYPFQKIGGVKNANLFAAVNLELSGSRVNLGFCSTMAFKEATAKLKSGDDIIFERKINIDPAHSFEAEINLPAGSSGNNLEASLWDGNKKLISYSPVKSREEPMPKPYSDPPIPSKLRSNEELYLAGLRIEQFHHPVLDAEPYWEEALRRDSLDSRVNLEMGIKALKQGRYDDAEKYLRRSLIRLTNNYTMPKDGEPFYYLGETLKQQERDDEASDCFYKAVWSAAFRAQGYYGLAEISMKRKELEKALDYIEKALLFDGLNLRAQNLKAAILRHLGDSVAALNVLNTFTYSIDPLDVRSLSEKWLATGSSGNLEKLISALKSFPSTAQETAAEFLNCGLYDDGLKILSLVTEHRSEQVSFNPMIFYYMAFFAKKLEQDKKAEEFCRLVSSCGTDYVFPFQNEAIKVLENALTINPFDFRAYYYLGNLLFDWQPEKAITLWEKSVAPNPDFAIPWRNLAVAFSHRPFSNNLGKAVGFMEKAVSQSKKYAIHFNELDELYEASGELPLKRLKLLENNFQIVSLRDDATAQLVHLEAVTGNPAKAIQLMKERKFEVWEGGSLNVAASWTDANILLGNKMLVSGNPVAALQFYEAAADIPENIPAESRVKTEIFVEINFLKGMAYKKMKNRKEASICFERSAKSEKVSGIQLFYRGLAKKELGIKEFVEDFEQLENEGAEMLKEAKQPDPQAPFSKFIRWRQTTSEGSYFVGISFLGRGDTVKAAEAFREALKIKPDHLWASEQLKEMNFKAN